MWIYIVLLILGYVDIIPLGFEFPRLTVIQGEGYQSPSGSSNGPAVGVASYDWLDFAVGSDTGGSMRGPAGAEGLFGSRPSHGALSMDNAIPLCSRLDTAGFFARSASLWAEIAHVWYDIFDGSYHTYPKSLYYPGAALAAINNSDVSAVIEKFMSNLEGFLHTTRQNVSIASMWEETHSKTTANFNSTFYSVRMDPLCFNNLKRTAHGC